MLDQHDFTQNVHELSSPAEAKPKLGDSVPLVNYPSPFTAFGNVFSADVNYVRPVLEMIHTEQWNSPAATQFRDEFLMPFHQAADWQGAYIKELALAAEIFRSTAEATKAGIKFVAQGCLAALKNHPIYTPTEGGTWRDDLSALSLVTAAIGLWCPAGDLAFAVGAISLGSGIASIPPADKKPYLQIEWFEFPHSILRATGYAIDELHEFVSAIDDTIAAGLDTDINSTDRFGSPYLKINGSVNSSDYGHLDITDGDGKPPDQVVVSIVQLARAGYYNMPGAGTEYDMALSKVDASRVPDSMSRIFPRSIGKFNTAVEDLAGLLLLTRDRLNLAGDAMATAARNYHGTDAENAEIMQQINQIPPPHSTAPFH